MAEQNPPQHLLQHVQQTCSEQQPHTDRGCNEGHIPWRCVCTMPRRLRHGSCWFTCEQSGSEHGAENSQGEALWVAPEQDVRPATCAAPAQDLHTGMTDCSWAMRVLLQVNELYHAAQHPREPEPCRRAADSAPAMLVAMVTLPGMPANATVSASSRSSSGLAVSNAGRAILDSHALDFGCTQHAQSTRADASVHDVLKDRAATAAK